MAAVQSRWGGGLVFAEQFFPLLCMLENFHSTILVGGELDKYKAIRK